MKDVDLYDIFLEILYEKIPSKTELVEELKKLLHIEREAVYRRLRKEVPFQANEAVTIAHAWNISLDEVIGINSGLVPFLLQPINYLNPSKKEIANFHKKLHSLEHFKIFSGSEHMEVGNKIPRPLVTGFSNLYRLKIFNWAFLYNTEETYIRFSDMIIPKELTEGFEAYNKIIKNISTSSFILDQKIFDYVVNSIKFYHSILLITDEEREIIKKELLELLDYIQNIASKGYYPETLNKVNIYISHLKLNSNYSYYYSDQLKSCRIHAFGKFDICSYEPIMVENFRSWMNQKKRSSIQISEVNERSRIEYFMAQREIVDTL